MEVHGTARARLADPRWRVDRQSDDRSHPCRPARRTARSPHATLFAWLIGGLVAAALTGGATFLALTWGPVVSSSTPKSRTPSSERSLASGCPTRRRGGPGVLVAPPVDLVVDVEGAVAHPGLVHIPTGGRVGDALTRAGGFAANAD